MLFSPIILISLVIIASCNNEPNTAPSEQETSESVSENTTSQNVENTGTEKTDQSILDKAANAEETVNAETETTQPVNDKLAYEIGDKKVFLGGTMIETDHQIIIEGQSNLIEGAKVNGKVSVNEDEYAADVTAKVDNQGEFHLEIPHHDRDNVETTVSLSFEFDLTEQTDLVERLYGDRGQNLEGPYIYKHQGDRGGGSPQNIFKMAHTETTFVTGNELAIRHFQEPDWFPIPEDLGDPNVWIEIEEKNNDKEFLYILARSNLLEGSIVDGEYNFESDSARVGPDGSFQLKIPYVYREDKQLIIEFNPSRMSQWNIIEETYGSKGQKLTGNLVTIPPYSSNQIIQKTIDSESTEVVVPDEVDLTMDGSEVLMQLPDNLLFDFDKYQLKNNAKSVLNEISETLSQFDDVEIQISGHTDNIGDDDYNQELSENRANEVKKYLQEKIGSEISFTTIGYGETRPISSNDTEEGQAKNRRVEISIDLRR